MDSFLPHFALAVIGGLATSVGPGIWARRPGGRIRLARARAGTVILSCLAVIMASGAGLVLLYRRFVADAGNAEVLTNPGAMLVFGLVLGLPFSLPTVIAVWADERRRAKARRGAAPATRADRREYAARLADQIREVGGADQRVSARVGGDGARTLILEGTLTSDQGERLVAALREDLSAVGFKRVEGGGSTGKWWTNV